MSFLEDERNQQRMLGEPFDSAVVPKLERLQRSLLGFRYERESFWASPYRAFRPRGLLIWNPPAMSQVRCEITYTAQVQTSFDPIPAAWFATAKTFEQLAAEIEAGKEPPMWCTWDSLYPGQTVKLEIMSADARRYGPQDGIELVMWGYVAR